MLTVCGEVIFSITIHINTLIIRRTFYDTQTETEPLYPKTNNDTPITIPIIRKLQHTFPIELLCLRLDIPILLRIVSNYAQTPETGCRGYVPTAANPHSDL